MKNGSHSRQTYSFDKLFPQEILHNMKKWCGLWKHSSKGRHTLKRVQKKKQRQYDRMVERNVQ